MGKGKKRRMAEGAEDSTGAGESAPRKEKKWKAVELGLDLMKDFEMNGGLFIEEADDDEYAGITYADEGLMGDDRGEMHIEEERKTKAKKTHKQKQKNGPGLENGAHANAASEKKAAPLTEAELRTENERLKQELAKLQPQTAPAEPVDEAAAAAEALSAWLPFELHPALMVGLYRQGFTRPTEVQARCLTPAIRQRKDMVGAAETGSGKTLAFGLPMLHHTLCAMDAEGGNKEEHAEGPGTSGASADPATSTTSAASSTSSASRTQRVLRGLVILPTRELAIQVQSHMNNVAQSTLVRTECVVGGMSILKQKRLLGRQPMIVVGTPGRLHALLGLGKEAETDRCDWLRASVCGLRHLVLDEADRLVESGHFKELDDILAHVYSTLERPQQLQTFVFSATLTLDPRTKYRRSQDGDAGKVGVLMNRLKFREARAVHTVDLTKPEGEEGANVESVEQSRAISAKGKLPEQLIFRECVCADDKDREALLTLWLLQRYRWGPLQAMQGGAPMPSTGTGGRVIIFVNAITSVLRLSSLLALLLESPSAGKVLSRVRMTNKERGTEDSASDLSVDVLGLHSRMRQKDRLKRMERFRSLKHAVLVCTDIAARGLDVPDVIAVLHYQAPRTTESFVHRSGRTARAGRKGESIQFMSPSDAANWGQLYRSAGVSKAQIEDIKPNAFEVGAAREASKIVAELELKVHRASKEQNDASWLRRTADEAELMLSGDEEDSEVGKKTAPRHALWPLYQQLQARTRRLPKRLGGAPLARRGRRR